MRTLMHMCCAPCANMPIQSLREEGIEVGGLWYNPNIHPFTEYRARRDALVGYAKTIGLDLAVEDDYGLRDFVRAVAGDIDARCDFCYQSRMERTAERAAGMGWDSFTTSLLISPYQNHERICQAAQAAGEKFGVAFLYRDFRPLFRAGQDRARALELYMQKYCGCVFSEEERYRKKR